MLMLFVWVVVAIIVFAFIGITFWQLIAGLLQHPMLLAFALIVQYPIYLLYK